MLSSERLELLEPGGYEIKIRPLVDATAALYRHFRGLRSRGDVLANSPWPRLGEIYEEIPKPALLNRNVPCATKLRLPFIAAGRPC